MKFFTDKKIIQLHILIWSCYLVLSWIQFYLDFKRVPVQFYYGRVFNILIFYFNYLYLVPLFLLKRSLNKYLLGVVLLLVLNGILHKFMEPDFSQLRNEVVMAGHNNISQGMGNGFPPPGDFKDGQLHRPGQSWFFDYLMPSVVPLLLVVIGAIIKMYSEWKAAEDLKREIAAKKVTSELQFLKTQINPHFLFNSLNTIYSLAVKQSAETPEAVINLSEMMRYMLYEADRDFVPLEKELDYLKSYIQLQRLRLADGRGVTLNIHGEYHHQKIQPLLFVSFVENAFKYGTDFSGKTQIKIVIEITRTGLTFICENVVGRLQKNKEHSGIGLENVKSRLKLSYPNTHELSIVNEDNMFKVKLYIKFLGK